MPPLRIDVPLVRCLVAEQLPAWASEPVRQVQPGGWDNRTFRLGEHLLVRLPSAAGYAPAVAVEQAWLPTLARHLPVAVPEPLAAGRPGCGYPWPWSVYRWLPGTTARAEEIGDLPRFARALAGFLRALHRVDATGGPEPGDRNGGRGGPLRRYDEQTRGLVAGLADRVDVPAVQAVWQAALASEHDGPPVWVHGDVTGTNLLVRDGRLSAVIDWGSCAVGDPACDLAVAWTLLDDPARAVFSHALSLDETVWARARGWALWKALLTLAELPSEPGAPSRFGWRLPPQQLIEHLVATA